MRKIYIFILKALRKIYTYFYPPNIELTFDCIQNADIASILISNKLTDSKPCMIARFGSTELSTMVNYIGVKNPDKSILKFIKGYSINWWWNENIINQMKNWSGFFPVNKSMIDKFCELMISDLNEVDILGSWLDDERFFISNMKDIHRINLELLNPYFSKTPWTKCLEGKTVLVIHPFAEQIETQYCKREFIFTNQDILPLFKLKTIKAVQSLGGDCNDFKDWFEALEYMKSEIDKIDYDVCLIGAGAYGFPLAAYVKRKGKKAVHLGGSLQLLFGIKGKRWEQANYNFDYNYLNLMNEHWVYPDESTRPKNSDLIEGACYW